MPFPNPDTQIKPGEVRNPTGKTARWSAKLLDKILDETPFHAMPVSTQKLLRERFGNKPLKEAVHYSLLNLVLEGKNNAVAAYTATLDRKEGKAVQAIEMDVTDKTAVSDRELARRIASVLTGGVVSPQESATEVLPQQGDIPHDQDDEGSGSGPAGVAGSR